MFSSYLLLKKDYTVGEGLGVVLAILVETALSLLWRFPPSVCLGIFVVGDSPCGCLGAHRMSLCQYQRCQVFRAKLQSAE